MTRVLGQIHELTQRSGRFLAPLLLVILVTGEGGPGRPLREFSTAVQATAAADSIAQRTPTTPSLSGEDSPSTQGREEPPRFEHLSITDGLSQNSANCILQDDKGFMYFGTQDGLNRFDGFDFSIFRPLPNDRNSLTHNYIHSLLQDRNDRIWIGTNGGGLDRFDPNTKQFINYRYVADDPYSLSSNIVYSIIQDREGTIWVGTYHGVNRYDPEQDRFSHYHLNPNDPRSLGHNIVRIIYEDQAGMLWIGTDSGGLDKFDPETEQFTHYRHNPADPWSLSNNSVRAIFQDRTKALWVGTDSGGLNRFDPDTEQFTRFKHKPDDPHSLSHDSVQAIHADQSGLLWIGTNGGGLNSLDPVTGRIQHFKHDLNDPYSLSSDFIASIFEDQTGTLWIGTFGGGVNRLDRWNKRFVHYQAIPNNANSLSENLVWALQQDREGDLWIGTNGGGLDHYNRDTGEWRHYRHDPSDPKSLSSNIVRSIFEDQSGDLWIGTQGGCLDRFDRSSSSFHHYPVNAGGNCQSGDTSILSMFQDRSGQLWIGFSRRGMRQLDPTTGRLSYLSDLDFGNVNTIRQGPEDSLWIGTSFGLIRWSLDSGWLEHHDHKNDDPESLSSNLVMSVLHDRLGTLWVGTFGGGLNRLNQNGEVVRHYRVQDGLPNDVIYGILEDDRGNLWLSTNMGLSRFDPRKETFTNYDVDDGLQSNEFNAGAYFQTTAGEILMGGINGFNVFYPEQIVDNPHAPPIVLTALTQEGQEVVTEQAVENLNQVRFGWPNNSFAFEFTALNYSQPHKNQYAYLLQGFDDNWNYVGARRYGTYTNLPGGNYVLRIIGSNDDGVWNREGVSVAITIVPPFWETWWFRGTTVLILLAGVFTAYRQRVNKIERQAHEFERQVKERTAELMKTNELLNQEIAERQRAEEALDRQAVEAAVLAERNRLARELHDAVTQTLFSASLIAEVVPQAWESDPESGREQLEQVRLLTRGALAEMRALLLELRPEALAEAKMEDLLLQLGRAMSSRIGIPVSVSAIGESNLPAAVKIGFYRVAQEALHNASKHANARQVHLVLTVESSQVILSIQDDGCGFEIDDIPPGHLGVGIMRERAAAIDARFDISSEPGEGTRVEIAWQRPPEEKGDE